jgi:hypothetical protein
VARAEAGKSAETEALAVRIQELEAETRQIDQLKETAQLFTQLQVPVMITSSVADPGCFIPDPDP